MDEADLWANVGLTFEVTITDDNGNTVTKRVYYRPCAPCLRALRRCFAKAGGVGCETCGGHPCCAGGRREYQCPCFLFARPLTPSTASCTVNNRRRDYQLVSVQIWGHAFVPITIPQGYSHLQRAAQQDTNPASATASPAVSPTASCLVVCCASRSSSPAPTTGVPLMEWEYRHNLFVEPRIPVAVDGMSAPSLHRTINRFSFLARSRTTKQLLVSSWREWQTPRYRRTLQQHWQVANHGSSQQQQRTGAKFCQARQQSCGYRVAQPSDWHSNCLAGGQCAHERSRRRLPIAGTGIATGTTAQGVCKLVSAVQWPQPLSSGARGVTHEEV